MAGAFHHTLCVAVAVSLSIVATSSYAFGNGEERIWPRSCKAETHNLVRSKPKKLGNSIVAYNRSGLTLVFDDNGEAERSASASWTATRCSDGSILHVSIWEGYGSPRYNQSVAFDEFEKTISRSKTQSLQALKARAEGFGLKTMMQVSNQESCGCAAHYPNSRGDKEPYRMGANQ